MTLISPRFDVAKDSRILGVCPGRELVVAQNEARTVGGVMIVDENVPMNESLKSKGKLFDFLINFVKSSDIVEEIELIGTDGGRGECSNSEILHPCVI